MRREDIKKLKVGDKLVLKEPEKGCLLLVVTTLYQMGEAWGYGYLCSKKENILHLYFNSKNIKAKLTKQNNPCPTCKERLRCLTKQK